MRFFSALFAVASIPAIAVLGNRLAGRGPALAALPARGGELDHSLPFLLDSLFLFLLPRCRTSPCSARPNEAGSGGLDALGRRHAAHHRVAPGHGRARARLPGALRPVLAPSGSARPSSPSELCSSSPSRSGAAVSCSPIVWRSAWAAPAASCARLGEVFAVSLARGRRRLDRLRRRPRDPARVHGVRPRLAGAETAAQRAPDRLRRDHADGRSSSSAGSAATRRPSRAT